MVSRIIGLFRRRNNELGCGEVRELSSDLIDEELNQATEVRVKSHLAKCGPCQAFVNTLRATVGLLRASPRPEAPSDLRQKLRENLRKEGHINS